MPFHQIREAIDDLSAMHRQLADHYARAAEQTDDPRAARLYRLIEAEEAAIESALAEFKETAPTEVLTTWLQYMPDSNLLQIKRGAMIDTDENGLDRIVQIVIATNESLRRLYRQLASVTSAERIQELFSDVEDIQLAKISKIAISTRADELVN